jgi:hypothetical protein
MADEHALQDPGVYDLSVELVAVAGRLVALCAAKGLHITREEVLDSVLTALEDEQTATTERVISLAEARQARGLPALARPIETPASESVQRLDVTFAFEGDRAVEVARMAEQLHGEVSEAACKRVLTSAAERGLSSLKRELNGG